jgi:hypothetical protein
VASCRESVSAALSWDQGRQECDESDWREGGSRLHAPNGAGPDRIAALGRQALQRLTGGPPAELRQKFSRLGLISERSHRAAPRTRKKSSFFSSATIALEVFATARCPSHASGARPRDSSRIKRESNCICRSLVNKGTSRRNVSVWPRLRAAMTSHSRNVTPGRTIFPARS